MDNNEQLGYSYFFSDEIWISLITGKNGYIIQPRVSKDKGTQLKRIRDKAEVFPCKICNAKNGFVEKTLIFRLL